MLVSTPTKPYMSPNPKYNRRHCTPPRNTAAYDSPMLPPSPLRHHPLFPLNTNVDTPAQAHSYNPFFAPKPQPIPADDEEGAIFLSSNSGSGQFPAFFSTSTSQPLRTPVKQVHRIASRSTLAANTLFGFGATPAAPPADLVSAQAARVGVGTKRKSTPHATPLRPNNLTPLKTAQAVHTDSSFERLAPLQAPKFTERTPQTKAETDAYLKRQTATLTRLRLSDQLPIACASTAGDGTEFDFEGPADDSGCEMDEDEPAASPFLNKPRKPAQRPRSLVFQAPVTKGKDKEEVAEAISPGGHVTKRRARSRPVSAELREQAFKVPKSPIRQSGIPCRVGGANRPRHSGPVAFPSTSHRGRLSPASNSSPSDAGSPRPRRRISGNVGSTSVRHHQPSFYPPRAPLSRIESVSSATLFFGPAIPAPSPSKGPTPTPANANPRSRTSSSVHSAVPVPFSPLPVPRQQLHLRPNMAHRHSYAGPESSATVWNAFQMRDVSPSPGSSPFQEDDQRSRRRDSTDMEDEDMFFAGEGDSSFVLSVTSPKPKTEPPMPMPLKYKPQELSLRNSVSDEEDVHSTGFSFGGGFLNVMPKASTSVSSFCSDDYEGLVTPGVTPDGPSGWPTNTNVFVNGADDDHVPGHPYGHDGGVDVDAFIMKTLADASKGAQTTGMPKKAPGTPVKKSRPGLAYFGVERPWQSAVASKVGLKDDCDFLKEGNNGKKPRKSMPAAFPVILPKPGLRERKAAMTRRNQDNNTDTEPEDAEESPSTRRDTGRYTGLGLGMPPPPTALRKGGISALPRNRWLMRRSSSGAFSSGGDSLTTTPTRTKGIDWQLPKPRIPLRLSPSGETLGKDSPRSASGSSSSSSIITLHSPTAARAANVNGTRAAHGQDHQQHHLAPRASVSTRTRRLSDAAYAIGFAGEDELQPGRFARDFEEIEEVGSGEFGKVIKAQRKGDDDTVGVYAIKKSKRFEGAKHRLRLREEVDTLKHLSQAALTQYVDGRHPNVLAYVDSWEEDEALFIQTELCESGNLARFLWEYGRVFPRLDEARVWKIVVDLSNGLRFIHDSGVIHLDLKPSNVFVTKEGRFKIGDFGMASLWPRPVDTVSCTSGSTATTRGFEREGDKLYLAPEVLQGRYGKAADVFSFGMTILETASNIVVPDQGEGWQRLRREDFSQVDVDELSPELVGLIWGMMRTDPGRRLTIGEVCAHPVVSRARGEMERVGESLRKEGKSEWGASPLASVAEGFLEMVLGEDAMDTGT